MSRGNRRLLDERAGEQQRLSPILKRDKMRRRLNITSERMYRGRIDGILARAVGVRGDERRATKAKVKVDVFLQGVAHKCFARSIGQRHDKHDKINARSFAVRL